MSRQLIHYVTSATPAPAGLGFDRWVAFLDKAGVASGTIGLFLIAELIGFACFALVLRGAVKSATSSSLA